LRVAIVTALAAIAVITAGCGAVGRVTSGNPAAGKALFVAKCGSCHTLANAKTTGVVGPDLDAAFAADKQQGFHQSTIADVVRGQIAYPTTTTGTGSPGMTANLLHGQDAQDVSVYVARCAADPHCTAPPTTVSVDSPGV
jgi:mono/diheme cytochrome c family protein